jgi:hypothetical protein
MLSRWSAIPDLKLDLAYLCGRMKILDLACPKVAEKFAPDILRKVSKDIRAKLRS